MPWTTTATHRHYVPIEHVRLGSRISTRNPRQWEYDDSLPEPDQNHYRLMQLTVHADDGRFLEIELLRPQSWIEAAGANTCTIAHMELPELQVSGIVHVVDLRPCPDFAEGDGSVVTGRFITRQVDEIVRLELIDESGHTSILEGTGIHPIWSLDRDDWTQLGELQPLERLAGRDSASDVH